MLYWDLIEEFLPDFEERADVKFDTSLFNFIHGGDRSLHREESRSAERNGEALCGRRHDL